VEQLYKKTGDRTRSDGSESASISSFNSQFVLIRRHWEVVRALRKAFLTRLLSSLHLPTISALFLFTILIQHEWNWQESSLPDWTVQINTIGQNSAQAGFLSYLLQIYQLATRQLHVLISICIISYFSRGKQLQSS